MNPIDFIQRWQDSGGAEIANSQSFLNELCDLLDVPHPDPTLPDESKNKYVYEKAVIFQNGDGTTSSGRVDLYRYGCFVLESKQGVERKSAEQAEALATTTKAKKFRAGTAARSTASWEQAMSRARQQVRRYAEAISDEWPPFLIVADVGYCFDVYADFTGSGKSYVPFPDPQSYRIRLEDLASENTRQLLYKIWKEPLTLDPTRRTAKVTREVAQRLAKLGKSLEGSQEPKLVAEFLMRCLFTMFAEDIELGGFKKGDFTRFLVSCRGQLPTFVPMIEQLWRDMDSGGFSVILRSQLKQFNGGLFHDHTAIALTEDQLELLIEAAKAEWNEVEPAIFGTLLERALDPVERHKLGAHYTPRAYVERLVMPTIIEPLREQWDTAYATAVSLYESSEALFAQSQAKLASANEETDTKKAKEHEAAGRDLKRKAMRTRNEAVDTVKTFHEKLCETGVLDPACGSGNFLYVALELMKRLEGEVIKALRDFGHEQQVLLTIDPHQFLGIEVNPRAAAIADLVLWIGYLQWHFRVRGDDLSEPIIRNFQNIECRDAVLAWDSIEPVVDEEGQPVTRWDGRTTKPHPVTGEEVPDETARVQEVKYINPSKAEWPETDYIVGNPPFIGNKRMRFCLGDAYTETLRTTFKDVSGHIDYVMYWWNQAAKATSEQRISRFGLITTNSITQSASRTILANWIDSSSPVNLNFAIADHPWVDSSDGASVRIAMTVGTNGSGAGRLLTVAKENKVDNFQDEVLCTEKTGVILSDLRIGADVASAVGLAANQNLSFMGVTLVGNFKLEPDELVRMGLNSDDLPAPVRPYASGREISQKRQDRYVIDFYGIDENTARRDYPKLVQRLVVYVKEMRDQNNRQSYRDNWWLFGETRPAMRKALDSLPQYIVTLETSKHRFFQFLPIEVVPDHSLFVIAISDGFGLGVLSSRIHLVWSETAGSTLEDRPRYRNGTCFEPFPFPDCERTAKQKVREIGLSLDAHRKRQQAQHPKLTMTGMYNVLEKLRSGKSLTPKEQTIHEQGLVSVLKQIHDDLDAAVFDAYGWPHELEDEEILQQLVDLNQERAAEEAAGMVRWLRPEFQAPASGTQQTINIDEEAETKPTKSKKASTAKVIKQTWPVTLPERITAVRATLRQLAAPVTPKEIDKHFKGGTKRVAAIEELLQTLVAVGQARLTDDGRYVE